MNVSLSDFLFFRNKDFDLGKSGSFAPGRFEKGLSFEFCKRRQAKS